MISRIHSFIIAALAFLLSAMPAATNAAPQTIAVGQAIDLSGPNGSIGRDYVAGIKTYFDALNANGGINGKRIQFIARDDQGRADLASKTVTDLIERDKIEFLFGGIGGEAMQAVLETPAFKRSELILFAPLAGNAADTSARVLFWRPGYRQEIEHLFSHFAKLGIKGIGIAYQDSAVNQEAYRSLTAEIKNRGLTLSGTAYLKADAAPHEMEMEAKRLAVAKPGCVVVVADTIATALFLKEFRNYAAQTFVAGTSLTNLATLRELAGAKASEWTVFSQVVPNPNSGSSLLQAEHLNMMRKYRDEPVSALTLEGFAAAKALAKTIQQAKNGHAALQELVAKRGDIDLGGLSILSSPNSNRLSSYLDIALFRKGSGLVF